MKNVTITKLEDQVLKSLINGLYAERGFSDVGIGDIASDTKLERNVIRGVASSLIKKGLISIDEREDEMYFNDKGKRVKMPVDYHIWYLTNGLYYLAHPDEDDTAEEDRIQLQVV